MLNKTTLVIWFTCNCTFKVLFLPFPEGIGWNILQLPRPFSHTTAAVSSAPLHELSKTSWGTLVQVQPECSNLQTKSKQRQLFVVVTSFLPLGRSNSHFGIKCHTLLGIKHFTASQEQKSWKASSTAFGKHQTASATALCSPASNKNAQGTVNITYLALSHPPSRALQFALGQAKPHHGLQVISNTEKGHSTPQPCPLPQGQPSKALETTDIPLCHPSRKVMLRVFSLTAVASTGTWAPHSGYCSHTAPSDTKISQAKMYL